MQKRGAQQIGETVIFITLNVIAIAALFLAVTNIGTSANLQEQAYAKQIALLMDASKKGTVITIDLTEIYQIAQRSRVNPIVSVDCETNSVLVKATTGQGYRQSFFTSLSNCPSTLTLNDAKRSATIIIQ